MILFVLFAVCSLIIVAAGVSTYKRISDNFDNTFATSAAVSYVTNKIRKIFSQWCHVCHTDRS